MTAGHNQAASGWDSGADVFVIRKKSACERHGSSLAKHVKSHNALMGVVAAVTDQLNTLGLSTSTMTIDELMDGRVKFFKTASTNTKTLNPRKRLAISIGGDGTLLHTSHYVGGETRLIGINAVPALSVGHLCLAKDSDFEKFLDDALTDRIAPKKIRRLEVFPSSTQEPSQDLTEKLDFAALPLALNDILFCNPHPAASSRYLITVKQDQLTDGSSASSVTAERHVSSGVWISTAAGSTAAISSYGLQRLPLESERFLLAVREPYYRAAHLCTLTRANLDGTQQSLEIQSEMPLALVAVDGADFSSPVGRGQGVWIRMLPGNELLLYI